MSIAGRSDLSFGDVISRLQTIAAESGDALLIEGPVNPDHALLDLCATALHHLAPAQKAQDARRHLSYADGEHLYAVYLEGESMGKSQLARIRKTKATTAAGIYAKAMVVRAQRREPHILRCRSQLTCWIAPNSSQSPGPLGSNSDAATFMVRRPDHASLRSLPGLADRGRCRLVAARQHDLPGRSGGRWQVITRRLPNAPTGAPRVLEVA
jgi:hypothetical protein